MATKHPSFEVLFISASISRSRSNSISHNLSDGICNSRSRSNSLVPESLAFLSFDKEEINYEAQKKHEEQTKESDKKLAEYFDTINIIDDANTASVEIPAISLNDGDQEGLNDGK